MIYTSYFAAMRKMTDEQKTRCVSIARFTPKGLKDIRGYAYVQPAPRLLKAHKAGEISEEQFKAEYVAQLDKIGADVIGTDLQNMILCCYEKTGDFCHRHILAKWLRDNGYECEELALSGVMQI